MRILVVNAGSSSIELSVIDGARVLTARGLPASGHDAVGAAIMELAANAGTIGAVGHRIVHGGSEFGGPTIITGQVRDRLDALTDLAPLHQPKSLAALDTVTRLLPGVPAVACFDTAFHATIPAPAAT
jgi:acetate kinase